MADETPKDGTPVVPEPTDRSLSHSVISLALFLHLFVVALVLSANFAPSALQQDLVQKAAPYARTLNFDPNFTAYHLTSGLREEDDHIIEVATASTPEEILVRYPDTRWNGSPTSHRFRSLAGVIAFHADNQMDSETGLMAKSIGAHVIARRAVDRVVVRCRVQHAQPLELSQPGTEFPKDPHDESYFETVYEADVWKSDDGSIQVLKRSARREVAPTRMGDSR